jgi:hypothetical protein
MELVSFSIPSPPLGEGRVRGNVRRDNLGKLNYYSFRKNGDLM